MTFKHKLLILMIFLGLLYLFLFSLSLRGWGYSGYRGYHRGPSFFYWGGPRYYANSSARAGSIGGPSHVGGGPHAGK
ncbi:MAG: hypothetical protein GY817_01855 [bacterium]|nr:hypothetical protein [bacterium]